LQAQYSQSPAMFKAHPFWFLLWLILIPVVVGLVVLVIWYFKCKSTRLEIIGNDLVLEEGFLSKDRTEINLNSVRTIKIHQSFFNRIFGVGKVSIFTAGDEAEINIEGMPDPDELRELIKHH